MSLCVNLRAKSPRVLALGNFDIPSISNNPGSEERISISFKRRPPFISISTNERIFSDTQ